MKKYPYIGEHATQPIINLFTRKGCYIRLNPSDSYDGKEYPCDSDTLFGDITEKYLSNTWGVVKSKEHAEFIVELAELHGFEVGGYDEKDNFFYTDDDYIGFTPTSKLASNRNEKQITIPLPPKAKEWPQVGDEADWGIASSGVIKSLSDGFAWIKQGNNDYTTVYISSLKKPKTKEDILTEELQIKLCNNNHVDNFTLASDIINGMIPGLSYNSVIERAVKIVINNNLDGDN